MILITKPQHDYELIDSGNGKKLERYGTVVMIRPDPQALWKPRREKSIWDQAQATFSREGKKTSWKTQKGVPESWTITFDSLTLEIVPTTFKHTGLFPEHQNTWQWMRQLITSSKQPVSVLNLFGYTGAASLACAQAGAHVTHVDGSKLAIGWAKKNQELSNISKDSIRWILDDAMKFVKRELKRGKTYDAIIMDPPAFGRGPDGDVWEIETHLPELLSLCKELLSTHPLFIVMNGYASGFSSIAYHNNLLPIQENFGGIIEHGELAIEESLSERLLPCGIFARWSKPLQKK